MKNYSKLIMVALIAIACIGVASAASQAQGESQGQSQTTLLVTKDPTTWETVDGAFGNLLIKDDGFMFIGHDLPVLEDEGEYSLISYNEPWGDPVKVLGSGTADEKGKLKITGDFGKEDLICNDYEGMDKGDYHTGTGSKVWLVPSGDLTGNYFNAWNPNTYLFENRLVNVGCDVPEQP